LRSFYVKLEIQSKKNLPLGVKRIIYQLKRGTQVLRNGLKMTRSNNDGTKKIGTRGRR